MYKKVFLLRIVVFCISNTILSQNFNYALYDIHVDEEKLSLFLKEKDFDPFQKNLFLKMANEVNRTQFELKFDSSTSLFQPIEQLSLGDYNLKIAKGLLVFLNIEDLIYFDTKTSLYYKKRGTTDIEHLVKIDKGNIKWSITEQEKVVGDLVYRKAFTKVLIDANEYSVEVWFCPSIPVQFGPSFYNGLPGLIMETSAISDTSELNFSFKIRELKHIHTYSRVRIPIDKFKVYSDEESQALFNNALNKYKN